MERIDECLPAQARRPEPTSERARAIRHGIRATRGGIRCHARKDIQSTSGEHVRRRQLRYSEERTEPSWLSPWPHAPKLIRADHAVAIQQCQIARSNKSRI